MHFGLKREPDRGTMMGLLDNRKSEFDFVQVGYHEGAFDSEAFDADAFDVDYKIFDKRIINA